MPYAEKASSAGFAVSRTNAIAISSVSSDSSLSTSLLSSFDIEASICREIQARCATGTDRLPAPAVPKPAQWRASTWIRARVETSLLSAVPPQTLARPVAYSQSCWRRLLDWGIEVAASIAPKVGRDDGGHILCGGVTEALDQSGPFSGHLGRVHWVVCGNRRRATRCTNTQPLRSILVQCHKTTAGLKPRLGGSQ